VASPPAVAAVAVRLHPSRDLGIARAIVARALRASRAAHRAHASSRKFIPAGVATDEFANDNPPSVPDRLSHQTTVARPLALFSPSHRQAAAMADAADAAAAEAAAMADAAAEAAAAAAAAAEAAEAA